MSDASLFQLEVMERDATLNPRQLRAAGFVPATLYSKDKPSENVQARSYDLERALRAGRRYYELTGSFSGRAANARQFQLDPVSQEILSIEFLEISLKAAQSGANDRADELAAQAEELLQAEANAKKAQQAAAAAEHAEAEAAAEAGAAPAATTEETTPVA